MESPPLEGFKSHVDMAPGDMCQWWPWQCWGEWLGSMILKSFSNSSNSVIPEDKKSEF